MLITAIFAGTFSLVASAISSSAIKLTWRDNSSNETAFEVSRSLTAGGPYTLVATTPANVTSVTDGSLPEITLFIIRYAQNLLHTLLHTAIPHVPPPLPFSVYENINVDNPAPAPWNNTNRLPGTVCRIRKSEEDQATHPV
jgi:hypothetical protein